jgi:hypothetical protein
MGLNIMGTYSISELAVATVMQNKFSGVGYDCKIGFIPIMRQSISSVYSVSRRSTILEASVTLKRKKLTRGCV